MSKIKFTIFILFIFSPLFAQFKTLIMLEPMPTARYGICSVVYEDNIWIIGGKNSNDSTLNLVECYFPYYNYWEKDVASLQVSRTNAAAVVFNDRIYVIGGKGRDRKALSSVEFFDPLDRQWKLDGNLTKAREALTAVVFNDTMYAIGGGMTTVDTNHLNDVEYYDENAHIWKIYPSWTLHQPRVSMASVVVGTSVYTFGGTYFGPVDYVEFYQPTHGTTVLGRMPNPRYSFAAAAVRDTIYIIGGASTTRLLPAIEFYDPINDRWDSTQNSLIPPRTDLTAVSFAGNIYIFGGINVNGIPVNITEMLYLSEAATTVEKIKPNIPDKYQLFANYPNPFNACTVIPITVPLQSTSDTELIIFNVQGKKVKTFRFYSLPVGEHRLTWDGTDESGQQVASGIYFYQLRVAQLIKATRKMMLLR